jgi:hypothetical protein
LQYVTTSETAAGLFFVVIPCDSTATPKRALSLRRASCRERERERERENERETYIHSGHIHTLTERKTENTQNTPEREHTHYTTLATPNHPTRPTTHTHTHTHTHTKKYRILQLIVKQTRTCASIRPCTCWVVDFS